MPRLLKLPTELLERILVLLCHENAQTIQSCRLVCHTLNTIVAHSQLVQYLERLALLGICDSLLVEGVAASATLSIADRVAVLRALEESWHAFTGGRNGDAGVFWQERRPNLLIASPASPSARITSILATIMDSGPLEGPEPEPEEDWHDSNDDFAFGPWLITRTRTGTSVRTSYSYLDLHGCLDGVEGFWRGEGGIESSQEENRDGDPNTDYDRVHWTVIKVPVRNVVAIALSTELDLALVISAEIESEGRDEERSHLAVRPLRFLDGTPHPCAKVQTMRFSVNVKGISILHTTRVQLLGDYLLLWFGRGTNFGVSKLYLIAWKQGPIILLRECPAGKYGTVHMISNDVIVLVQLDPPGLELCRLTKWKNEAEGGGGGPNDGPRMEKLCTLLLPPLRQRRDADESARATGASCVGGETGHHTPSHGPWPEYRSAPLGRRQMFRQSTKDSIVKVMMFIKGCQGLTRTIEVFVRCSTLLAYAGGDRLVLATATIVADAESSNGDGDGQSARVQAVMGDANADIDAKGGTGDVPWDAWGPRATAVSDHTHAARRVFGERMTTTEISQQMYIRDFNPYRIRQARASMAEKCHGGVGWVDSHEEDHEGSHPRVTRRINESRTLRGGDWFEEDVTTALPHLAVKVDLPPGLPGLTSIYMEQDQVLLRVGDLDQVTGKPYRRKKFRESEGFALYSM